MIEAIDNIFEFKNGKSFDVYRNDKMLCSCIDRLLSTGE